MAVTFKTAAKYDEFAKRLAFTLSARYEITQESDKDEERGLVYPEELAVFILAIMNQEMG
jgi:hypothetical protein